MMSDSEFPTNAFPNCIKTKYQVLYLPGFQFDLKPVKFENNQVSKRKGFFNLKLNTTNVKVLSQDNLNEANKILLILERAINRFPENHPARTLQMKISQKINFIPDDALHNNGPGQAWQQWRVKGQFHSEMYDQILDWMPRFKNPYSQLSVEAIIRNATANPKSDQQKSGVTDSSEKPVWLRKLYETCRNCEQEEEDDCDCDCAKIGLEVSTMLDPKIDYTFTADLTIKIVIFKIEKTAFLSELRPFPNILKDVLPLNRQILEKKMYTDMYIKTDSGTWIPCHKTFLTETSPVIDAIFKDRLKQNVESTPESNNSELRIEDVSDETVHAFLGFVYCGDIEKAMNSGRIAVELLILANRYNVGLMEEKMLQLVYRECEEFFAEDIESLLKCYLFLELSGQCKLVEITLAEIIKRKSDEILKSQEYQDLLDEDSQAAGRIIKCCGKSQ